VLKFKTFPVTQTFLREINLGISGTSKKYLLANFQITEIVSNGTFSKGSKFSMFDFTQNLNG